MTSKLNAFLLLVSFLSLGIGSPARGAGFDWKPLSLLGIQDRGRIKPFNTFAAESVQYVTGKKFWQGLPPEEVVFGWLTTFESNWAETQFILVDNKPFKEAIGIDALRRHFSPNELMMNRELGRLARDAFQKSQSKRELSTNEKKASETTGRLNLLQAIVSGEAVTILPHPDGPDATWLPLSALTGQSDVRLPYGEEKNTRLAERMRELVLAFIEGKPDQWNQTLPGFTNMIQTELTDAYPDTTSLSREYHYNQFRPFRWAWVVYTLAFLMLLVNIVSGKPLLKKIGLGALAVGFGIHTYGFILRSLIAGRPPVTNMYESVIWVSWGCILFAALIFVRYRNAVIPAAASVFSVVSLVLADNLPSILDPSINPLEPVLRSNFWLTIHVLTITLSYAAFALSLCLGNVVLGYHAFSPRQTERIQEMSLFMYRAVQIGVVLLAAGTILGGVWADYSWGRFWGWDPKEVWALVALLLYVAVLHGRFAGWLRGFGFAAANVISFLGVLMAWYGVNFVLGAGLHSYGFGTGGLGYVSAYIIAQLAFIGLAYQRHRGVGDSAAIFPKGHR